MASKKPNNRIIKEKGSRVVKKIGHSKYQHENKEQNRIYWNEMEETELKGYQEKRDW